MQNYSLTHRNNNEPLLYTRIVFYNTHIYLQRYLDMLLPAVKMHMLEDYTKKCMWVQRV